MQKVYYPIYVIHSDNVEELDGILWLDDQVLDDKNMQGGDLGMRRLQSPMKSIYPLRYMIEDEISMLKHRGTTFIDSKGNIVIKEKNRNAKLIYHKILKRQLKDVATIVWLKDIPFPFIERRPPPSNCSWAGVLHLSGLPWKIWEYCEEKKKDTWRKV